MNVKEQNGLCFIEWKCQWLKAMLTSLSCYVLSVLQPGDHSLWSLQDLGCRDPTLTPVTAITEVGEKENPSSHVQCFLKSQLRNDRIHSDIQKCLLLPCLIMITALNIWHIICLICLHAFSSSSSLSFSPSPSPFPFHSHYHSPTLCKFDGCPDSVVFSSMYLLSFTINIL